MDDEQSTLFKKPKRSVEDKLKAAQIRVKQLREQARANAARKAKEEAKIQKADDNRRRILLGAMSLKRMQSDEQAKATFLAHLDKYLEREDDRKLFNLPPL